MRSTLRVLFLALSVLATGAGAALAADGYQLRPGDVLRVEVLEDPSLNREVLVLPDGSIDFPLVGTVAARGQTVASVRQALTRGLADTFAAEPTVFVAVRSLAERPARGPEPEAETIDVYALGEVAEPGRKEVTPGTTILQFLADAGGLTRFAAEKRIELRRTDRETGAVRTYLFSFSGAANGPRIAGSTRLAPGDVVVVPSRRLFE
ncbi:polysaccharide biosynthesis/export family protein [Rhodosalinus sp. K401]|uniref:polysaccharide biosynthesis/export family protein n=1 Tax=Rhodosalinus sp. K401 TaxID=3239195 RepID=UPI003525BD98